MSTLIECPGEAHELDNMFNPSTQGPYGPGSHHCDVCGDTGLVTREVYEQWHKDQLVSRLRNAKK